MPSMPLKAPNYEAPIIKAMDSSLPIFVGFKHSSLLKAAIMNSPPKLSEIVSPATSGLVDLQQVCLVSVPPVILCSHLTSG
jgi:hypothetical protein